MICNKKIDFAINKLFWTFIKRIIYFNLLILLTNVQDIHNIHCHLQIIYLKIFLLYSLFWIVTDGLFEVLTTCSTLNIIYRLHREKYHPIFHQSVSINRLCQTQTYVSHGFKNKLIAVNMRSPCFFLVNLCLQKMQNAHNRKRH